MCIRDRDKRRLRIWTVEMAITFIGPGLAYSTGDSISPHTFLHILVRAFRHSQRKTSCTSKRNASDLDIHGLGKDSAGNGQILGK